ncbi:MAG: hypothetical protein H7A06_12070 [Pseudomonadales bacterium]|nr:hypothetical protein [Pseudomonadales bacterium]
MDNSAKVRRTLKLCLGCLRGAAYYRAGQKQKDKWIDDDFCRHNNTNSIDMSVIDWCKVFGDPKAKHYWKKSVKNPDELYSSILTAANVTESEFEQYIGEMREYRDKFLAHLDEANLMHIPHLDIAISTSISIYNHLAQGGSDLENIVPNDAQKFYDSRLKYAEKKYEDAT